MDPNSHPDHKTSMGKTFLDDIFMIWEHSKKEFYKFVKILNTHHPSITVKAELSSESMYFLDTVVYKGNIFKPTNRYFGTVTQEITSPKPYF